MNTITHIYILIDPRDSEVRYVGKTTKNPQTRLTQHISEINRTNYNNIYKNNWIKNLAKENLNPIILVIDTAEQQKGECWEKKERYWIKYFKDKGEKLTNIEDGGTTHWNEAKKLFKNKPFPDKYIHLLGTMKDNELSRIAKVHTETVTKKRRELNIKPIIKPKKFEWNKSSDELLGTKPDRELAEQLGITLGAIRARRHRLRIEIPEEFLLHNDRKWKPDFNKYLGVFSDSEIARKLGFDPEMVRKHRVKKGIQSPPQKRPGKTPVEELLEAEYIALLGTMTDKALAEKVGCSWGKIQQIRKKLSIPPFQQAFEWTEEKLNLLGTTADSKIAQKLGTTTLTVRKKKRKIKNRTRWVF